MKSHSRFWLWTLILIFATALISGGYYFGFYRMTAMQVPAGVACGDIYKVNPEGGCWTWIEQATDWIPTEGDGSNFIARLKSCVFSKYSTGILNQCVTDESAQTEIITSGYGYSTGCSRTVLKCLSSTLSAGYNLVRIDYYYRDSDFYVYSAEYRWVYVAPLPCVYAQNQFLVFDQFASGDSVNLDALSMNFVKFCGAHPIVRYREDSKSSVVDFDLNKKLGFGYEEVVPSGEVWGIFYVAEIPSYLPKVCQVNEVYVVKEGICAATGGIITTCMNGVINSRGECVVQPTINYVCSGQVIVLPNGTQVCNIILPVRENYECTSPSGEKYNVDSPLDCIKSLKTTTYCLSADGSKVEVISASACNVELKMRYYCVGNDGVKAEVLNVDSCSSEETVKLMYDCEGKIVDKPEDCKEYIEKVIHTEQVFYCPEGFEYSTDRGGCFKLEPNILSKNKSYVWYAILVIIIITAYFVFKKKKGVRRKY